MSRAVSQPDHVPWVVPPLPEYPCSDGRPKADNTEQFDYIVYIKTGLDWDFKKEPQVFVAGDLLWYPVEGNNKIRCAPDVFVVFGRPKGPRGSYLQWLEDGIAPQVAFEIVSPSNTKRILQAKLEFYEKYGVEEYYLFDPKAGSLKGWLRQGATLEPISSMGGWASPRLRVRFELTDKALKLYNRAGKLYLEPNEWASKAEKESKRADAEKRRADAEKDRADQLAAKLRSLGIDGNNL